MTSVAILAKYRAVRDVIADIQLTATAVDEHLGRYQIFGAPEEFTHAVARAESLEEKLRELEHQLRRCLPTPQGDIGLHLSWAQALRPPRD